MSKVKFIANADATYECVVTQIGLNQVRVTFLGGVIVPDESVILSGFDVLNEYNDQVMTSYEDYTYKYRDTEEDNVFELDNDNVPWVEPEPPYIPPTPTPVPPYVPTLAEVLSTKLDEFTSVCRSAIEGGVDIDIDGTMEHFSYSLDGGDQNNIDDIFVTMLNTGLPQYYHCDGGECKLYTLEQVFALYAAQKANKLDHTTYLNLIRIQLNELYGDAEDTEENRNDVSNMVYKEVALEGEYLTRYTEIMQEGAKSIEAFRKKIFGE